jgi:hypothetical protein
MLGVGVMMVLLFFVVSFSIGAQPVINDASAISSQFALSNGHPPSVNEIYWCC